MEVTKLLESEERAVSPVIGVILMVAITVILAAVIGTFVLGLGEQVQDPAPNSQWSWEQTDVSGSVASGTYQATISHEGGQSIDPERVSLTVSRSAVTANTADAGTWSSLSASGDITAGSSIKAVNMDPDGDSTTDDAVALEPDDEVRLVWRSESGDKTAVLTRHTVN